MRTTLLIAALLVICIAAFFIVRYYSISRARNAIARADEYWNSIDVLYEPRYRDAQKAVSDMIVDSLDSASLKLCLANIQRSREYLKSELRTVAIQSNAASDHKSRKEIQEIAASVKDLRDRKEAMRKLARACVADMSTDSAPANPAPLSDAEKLRRGCQVVKLDYGDKPIAQLSINDLQKIQLCQSLGLYQ